MRILSLAACLWVGLAQADWQFSAPVDVLGAEPGVFPHLEAANRQGLAESGGTIAVTWEDNRSGSSQCYVRFKSPEENAFGKEVKLSTKDCVEPVVVGLGNSQFLAGWEENGAVWVALVQPGKSSAPLKLSQSLASQVTLAFDPKGGLHAAWAEQSTSGHLQLWAGKLENDMNGLRLTQSQTVEKIIPIEDQTYPALAVNADGSVAVVWEDRRFGHTVMLASYSRDGEIFDLPFRLIDVHGSGVRGPAGRLGAGMGAMRPTLYRCGLDSTSGQIKTAPAGSCVVAVWMDKRDFLSGYDVYAGISQNGGQSFGRNLKVQDSFGENIAQWHAAVGANQQGRIVAVWDDDRDGNADIWLANWNGSGFSDNVAVPSASGAGIQADPMIHLDDAGRLHLIWLDKPDSADSPRIRYIEADWRD
jgi:hypothetical protein